VCLGNKRGHRWERRSVRARRSRENCA
jgi:hypothetical protein